MGSCWSTLYGSTDLFPDTLVDADRRYQNINLIDCHDRLNLCDVVSYTHDGQRSWAAVARAQ